MPEAHLTSESIDERTRVVRAPRVIGRRIHGQMVLVLPPALDARVLNDLGARVWELADGRTIDEITRTLTSELDEPRARVAADVRAFVEALVQEALLDVER